MRFSVKKEIGSYLLSAFLLFPQEGFTIDNTWYGTISSDLNTAGNWSLGHVPAPGEVAVFDTTQTSRFQPTATATFTADAIQFNQSAQDFSFTFSEAPLIFNAGGILGTPSNTTMTLNNLTNPTPIASQLVFNNVPSALGSANISLTNTGSTTTLNGNLTASQLAAPFNFSLSDGAFLSASNLGTDTSGVTAQRIGIIGSSQFEFDQNFNAGNFVTLSATNTGLDDGTATTNNTGIVEGAQFAILGAFSCGDNLVLEASNTGTSNNVSATGGNIVGIVDGAQINFQSTFDVGNNVNLTATNTATDNSVGSGASIGSIENQIIFGGPVGSSNPFSNGLSINAQNTANATLGAGSKSAGYIEDIQLKFLNTFITGNNASIVLSNSGTYSDTYTNGGSTIGCVDYTGFSADSSFQAGDGFVLSVENTGVDHSIGVGGNSVGSYLNNSQAIFSSSLQLGDDASLSFTNSGTFDGQNSTGGNKVGSIGNYQLYFPAASIQAGDNFNLTVSNIGDDSSQGFGGNNTASAINNTQVEIDAGTSMVLGDHATITITNNGTFSGSVATAPNRVGYFGNPQLSLNVPLQTGDHFSLIVTNTGNNSSSGVGGNDVGFIDDPQTEYGPVSVGNNALFQISNTGVDSTLSAMDTNSTGVIGGQQMSFSAFSALDNLTIQVSNSGTQIGAVMNAVGLVQGSQLEFGGLTQIGSNGAITVTNTSATENSISTVGAVLGYQFVADTDFTAGNNLALTVTNNATGIYSSNAGFVTLGQVGFLGNCTLGDGSVISVANEGFANEGLGIIGETILSLTNQMYFAKGFTINGTATLQAFNSTQGNVTGHGILIEGGSGGNALIYLDNTDLNISSPNAFTIGGLNGNTTAIAASLPEMIINLAPTTSATFAGIIENYGILQPTVLQIAGSGVQTLTGTNIFTGETSVVGGTLVLNGTIPGNISVYAPGTLKGSGAAGSATINGGIIAPGQSIGTLFFTNLTINSGIYDVEVNGAGQSDLIDVTATATLNGGQVEVSTVDGTYAFQKRYTIVEAGSVAGQFAGAFGASPLIRPVVTYDPQHVYLEVFANFAAAANTHNQRAVADQLDGIINPNALQTQLLNEIVSLDPAVAQSALDSLSGWQYTSNIWVAELVNNNFIKRLYDGIRPLVTDPNAYCGGFDSFNAWIEGGATFKDLHGNSHAHGFSSTGGEVTLGMHKTFHTDWTVGLAGSYEYDHLRYKSSGGSNNFNTGLGAFYALYRPECFYLFSDLAYGYSSSHMNRKMEVGDLTFRGRSNPTIQQLTFYGEVGVDWTPGSAFLVQPFFGLVAGETWSSRAFEQPAGGWELGIQKRGRALFETRLGVHVTTPALSEFECSIDLAWAKRITGSNSYVDGQFLQFGTPFEIDGVSLDSNSFDYAITFSKGICGYLLYVQASGQAWTQANDVDVLAGVQYTW